MKVQTRKGTVFYYDWFTNEIGLVKQKNVLNSKRIANMPLESFNSFPNLDTYVLEITRKCNLRCSYCCYSGEYRHNREHGSVSMTASQINEVLEFVQRTNTQQTIGIGFYGGECLLEFDIIKYCVRQAKQKLDKDLQFFLSTNGVLLDEEKTDWFVENQFLLNVSLDGPQLYNDRNRRNAFGEGCFRVTRNHLGYIKERYPDFFESNVNILMTLSCVDDLLPIAIGWSFDEVLKNKAPAQISKVAPNYRKGVEKANEEEIIARLYKLLDAYILHPEYVVLKAFLKDRITDWLERPIFNLAEHNRFSVCLPKNKKLFIDASGKIGVCEKMCDIYRMGDISYGIDWAVANDYVEKLVEMRKTRCCNCPIIRMCDICLTSLDLSKEELNVFCHNQKVYTKAFLLLFCEMAELGLIEKNE